MMKLTFASQPQNLTYSDAIESFLFRCRSKNLTSQTINWYKWLCNHFANYIKSHFGDITPQETYAQHVRSYLDNLRTEELSSYTIKMRYTGLKATFSYLEKEGITEQNPITNVEKPKSGKHLIKPFSTEQISLLLNQPDTKTFTGLRDWTMLVLLIDTGLRIAELLALKTLQIDWQNSSLNVFGKGSKERAVPFGSKTKKALWDYFKRRGDIAGQDIFFVDQFGRPIKKRHFQRIVTEYGLNAKIQGVRISPHTLRHTFATQYILNGGDAFSLQQILGHSTLDMVRIYVGLANRDVALQHQKFSPIDRLGVLPNQRKQVLIK